MLMFRNMNKAKIRLTGSQKTFDRSDVVKFATGGIVSIVRQGTVIYK